MRVILEAGGVESSSTEARWIVEAAIERDPNGASIIDQGPVNEREQDLAVALAERRANGEPLQYVTGVAGFRRLVLAVGPGVMIPRPETEVVAEWAMTKLPSDGVVVDCGTGSGAIALAIADERPDAQVIATESSATALRWAEKNRSALGLDIDLVACDLLDGLDSELRGRVDVVVSNPPYVRLSERGLLPLDVVDHEPHEALFAGEDGLDVIRRLAVAAVRWVRPGGWLVLETGAGHAAEVREILRSDGYEAVDTRKDLTGRPRIALGRKRR